MDMIWRENLLPVGSRVLVAVAPDDGYGPQTRWEPEPATVTLGRPRHPGESRDLGPLKAPAQVLPETPASAGVTCLL